MGSSTSRNNRHHEEEIRDKDAVDLAEKGLSDDRLNQLQEAAIKCLKERNLRVCHHNDDIAKSLTDRAQKLIKHMESIVIEKKIAEKKRQKQEQLKKSDYLGVSTQRSSYGLMTYILEAVKCQGVQRCRDDSRYSQRRPADKVGKGRNRVEMVRQILAVLLGILCEGHGGYDPIRMSSSFQSSREILSCRGQRDA